MVRLLQLIIVFFVSAAISGFPVASAEAKRVAFVVGNADYSSLAPLKNPQRDAGAVADRLKDLGFKVTELFNADAYSLNRAAKNFVAESKDADLALFYFAGHGVQLFDRNFLLARDADPKSASRPQDLGLDLTGFMVALQGSGAVRLALLIDACRDNPLSFEDTVRLLDRLRADPTFKSASTTPGRGTRGLARLDLGADGQGPKGTAQTLLFFAAQPGAVSFDGAGLNSYYVEGLKEQLARPDRSFTEILRGVSAYVRTVTSNKQVPQIVSDWTDDTTAGPSASAAKINYQLSKDKSFTPAERDLLVKSRSGFTKFRGDFIAKASIDDQPNLELTEKENLMLKALVGAGLSGTSGLSISYDLDRDGRDETLHIYGGQVGLVMALEVDGVRARVTNCLPGDAQRVEIALRDVNGDRRPEVWIAYESETTGPMWGKFCVLEYKGIPDLANLRRANTGNIWIGDVAFRTLLDADSGWYVTVANDNTIKACGGTGCHTFWTYAFKGGRFQLIDDDSKYGLKIPSVLSSPSTAGSSDLRGRIASFITEKYFRDSSALEIRQLLASSIDYYGKQRTRDEVVREKLAYYAKWPERTYTLIPETLLVSPAPGLPGRWNAEFQYTFRVGGQKGVRSGRGVARLVLVAAANGGFLIAAESGEVLSR